MSAEEVRVARDILKYTGTVTYEGFRKVVQEVSGSPETKDRDVILLLITLGGDPHAAFRIAQFLKTSYRRVIVFVPSLCKSAGTLICIGADEVSIAETGELGPLDVQVQKPSELIAYSSGLAIPQALAFLLESASESLKSLLHTLIVDQGLGPEKAAEIAVQTTVGLYQPVYAQIDPLRIGEITREQTIAEDYAKRLRPGIHQKVLSQLVTGYSSHAFVINRYEAAELLQNVRKPDQAELELASGLGQDIWRLPFKPTNVTYNKANEESGSQNEGDTDATQRGNATD